MNSQNTCPDSMSTRQAVRLPGCGSDTTCSLLPFSIPLLALVDADPHGLDILSVFKFGSASMEHERETLEAPRLQHIGVWATELDLLVFPTGIILWTSDGRLSALSLLFDHRLGVERDGLLPLSLHDHKKVSLTDRYNTRRCADR